MAESEPVLELQLAERQPAAATAQAFLALAAAAVLGAGGFAGYSAFESSTVQSLVPTTYADLGDRFVTPVDSKNRAAVSKAVAALRLPDPQRAEFETAVLHEERRIGWIVLVDSMDPDGDAVSVRAGGLSQNVVLSKAWTPVAVPIGETPIGITAIRDGGGGVTVALANRNGPQVLRVMAVGEHIEVVP